MEEKNNTSEGLFDQTATASNYSTFYSGKEDNGNEEENTDESPTTGIQTTEDQNTEIHTTGNPNTETQPNEDPYTEIQTAEVKFNNYPEKENYEDKQFDFFINNDIFNPNNLKRIFAAEYYKSLDNYYLNSLIHECSNLENLKFSFVSSKNYVPKDLVTKKNLFPPREFLYYDIKIENDIYCTYINERFGLNKLVYKIPSNSRNNT